MKQIATVDKLFSDGRAEIVVARQSACAHDCGECAGCGGTPAPIAPYPASVDEEVTIG